MEWNVIAAAMVTEAIEACELAKGAFIARGADEREAGTDLLNVAPMLASAYCKQLAGDDRERYVWLMRRTAAALYELAGQPLEDCGDAVANERAHMIAFCRRQAAAWRQMTRSTATAEARAASYLSLVASIVHREHLEP
jgi:hypothetical protein